MITHKQRRTEKGLCFKHYFKWILCFSFTLYFLVSFLVDHNQEDLPLSPSSLSRPNTLLTNPKTKFIASHVVFESKIHDHTLIFPPQRPNIRTGMLIKGFGNIESSICLLNCGPTGSEALKTLVLGGVGSITVVDGSKVELGDLGNNFMGIFPAHWFFVGQSKAKSACAFLQELNDSVKAKLSRLNVFNNLKIYVYDLPSKFNTDWLANDRCSNHLFAAEVALHKALLSLEGDVRTKDPHEADFFFVPVYVSCNFSTVNGFPAIGHARSLIKEAIDLVSAQYPFWNRTTSMPRSRERCDTTRLNVTKERTYISPVSLHKTQKNIPVTKERDIRVFFWGKMEIHPRSISGRFYSKRVRTEIWRSYGSDRRFYLQRQRFAGYQSEIARSVFCLCPLGWTLGWAPWSPRLVESVALGCVPVIIADGIRLPFPSAVRWPDISLTVAERDVGKLGEILEHVAETNLSVIQKNLEDPSVKRALLFNVPPQEGDATWQVLEALSKKLHRSATRRSNTFL
ncbi:hypothetical protein F2Q69_00012256 [Brassica cretica]|uniref:Exostosin GT47 domain-containing protein n=1 Tax=Brassica cretica TaxID=69181 RepID=A0A8S9QZ65_BRACR|nr:hypothetical protein F2Q69_00012256 [Brassica cretica]